MNQFTYSKHLFLGLLISIFNLSSSNLFEELFLRAVGILPSYVELFTKSLKFKDCEKQIDPNATNKVKKKFFIVKRVSKVTKYRLFLKIKKILKVK